MQPQAHDNVFNVAMESYQSSGDGSAQHTKENISKSPQKPEIAIQDSNEQQSMQPFSKEDIDKNNEMETPKLGDPVMT